MKCNKHKPSQKQNGGRIKIWYKAHCLNTLWRLCASFTKKALPCSRNKANNIIGSYYTYLRPYYTEGCFCFHIRHPWGPDNTRNWCHISFKELMWNRSRMFREPDRVRLCTVKLKQSVRRKSPTGERTQKYSVKPSCPVRFSEKHWLGGITASHGCSRYCLILD